MCTTHNCVLCHPSTKQLRFVYALFLQAFARNSKSCVRIFQINVDKTLTDFHTVISIHTVAYDTTTTAAIVRRYGHVSSQYMSSSRTWGNFFFFFTSHPMRVVRRVCVYMCRRVYTYEIMNICAPVPVRYEILYNSNNQHPIIILSVRRVEYSGFLSKCVQNG